MPLDNPAWLISHFRHESWKNKLHIWGHIWGQSKNTQYRTGAAYHRLYFYSDPKYSNIMDNQPGALRFRIEALWYGRHPLSALLVPLSWLYRLALACRRFIYAAGVLPVRRLAAPVIVVGNLTVGGTGKTPLVIWLARYLLALDYKPGIISRGYAGSQEKRPRRVEPDSDPDLVGDEPVLLAQRTGCPVAVAPDRVKAAQELLRQTDCNILLSDDGLQHTSLGRDIEIAVIDGVRRFGNRHCLPAGPLREPLTRLNSVDLIVANGNAAVDEFLMEYTGLPVKSLDGRQQRELSHFSQQTVHAVAAICNPERFFSMLRHNGINIVQHVFPDHYGFKQSDLEFGDAGAILMTEKDAVKCRRYGLENAWYVPIDVKLPETFARNLRLLLEEVRHG